MSVNDVRNNDLLNNINSKNYAAIEFENFGSPDELKIVERCNVKLLPTQIRVRNYATSINPIDFKTRQGLGWAAAQNADKLPMVLGYDVAGEVIEKGEAVTEFDIGDSVVGFVGFPLIAGAYAQHIIATESELSKTISHDNAYAALPLAGLTAYQGLFDIGKLQSGETVLISGASGGVGYLAVQLALNAGANVIAVAGLKNHELLKTLGDVTVIDYKNINNFQTLPDIDLWLDLIGGDNAISQLSAANNVSRLVTIPTITKDQVCETMADKLVSSDGMLVNLNKSQLTILVKAVEKGELRLNIGKYIDYKDAISAHILAESGQLNGKIIITLD